jgi:hypothetical protein
VQDENGDLLSESHNIGGRNASLLLNMHKVSNVRQIEIYTAEPLVPDSSFLQVEIAITNLKNCKSPGSDQIPVELFQAEGETLMSEIHKLVNSVWNKEELPDQWNESILYQFTKIPTKLTVVIILGYHYYQLHTKFY